MKTISSIILLMYAVVMINSLAFAQTVLSTGTVPAFGIIGLKNQNTHSYNYEHSANLIRGDSLRNFVQDLPQLQGYNWPKAEEEIKRLTAFLTKG